MKNAVHAIGQGFVLGLAMLGLLRVGELIGVADYTPRAEVILAVVMVVSMSIFTYVLRTRRFSWGQTQDR
jgi:hypothetical protein